MDTTNPRNFLSSGLEVLDLRSLDAKAGLPNGVFRVNLYDSRELSNNFVLKFVFELFCKLN